MSKMPTLAINLLNSIMDIIFLFSMKKILISTQNQKLQKNYFSIFKS